MSTISVSAESTGWELVLIVPGTCMSSSPIRRLVLMSVSGRYWGMSIEAQQQVSIYMKNKQLEQSKAPACKYVITVGAFQTTG